MSTYHLADRPSVQPAIPSFRERYPYSVLNMSTGPVHVTDNVLRALLDGHLSSHTAQFWRVYDEVSQMLSRVFRTKQPALALHGSIRTGLELCLCNLLQRQDKVLVLCNGFWSDYLARNAAEFSEHVVRVDSSPYRPFDLSRLRAALDAHRDVRMVIAVHVETNTGVVNDVQAICAAAREVGALAFIDTACSTGCIPAPMDDWGIDACVTGSHKTLGALSGLALIALSPAAMERARQVSRLNGISELRSLASLFERCTKPGRAPSYTHSTPLLLALHAALHERLTPSLEHWEMQCVATASEFRQQARLAGLAFVTDGEVPPEREREQLASSVMALRLPEGVDEKQVRERMESEHGIFVIGNVGELAGKSVRVGLMSPVQMDRKNWGATIAALKETIAYCSNHKESHP